MGFKISFHSAGRNELLFVALFVLLVPLLFVLKNVVADAAERSHQITVLVEPSAYA